MAGESAWKGVLSLLGVVAILAALGYGCMWANAQQRLDECEEALEGYVVEGGVPPALLTEDWCFDHLLDEADVPDELRERG